MKNGFRVYDSDTHVNPATEVLERYVDPGFRPRLAELEPYRFAVGQGAVGGVDGLHNYRVGTKYYRRVLGEKAPRETFTGRETRWMGSKMPRPGVQDDQAENRVKDMDDEGTDVHFLIPTSWLSLVGLPDPALEIGVIRAYHRHMADFCGQFPTRLKSMIVASSRNIDEAVREIREWGNSKWAVAVMPLLAKDVPADHPDLHPIWRAAAERRDGRSPRSCSRAGRPGTRSRTPRSAASASWSCRCSAPTSSPPAMPRRPSSLAASSWRARWAPAACRSPASFRRRPISAAR